MAKQNVLDLCSCIVGYFDAKVYYNHDYDDFKSYIKSYYNTITLTHSLDEQSNEYKLDYVKIALICQKNKICKKYFNEGRVFHSKKNKTLHDLYKINELRTMYNYNGGKITVAGLMKMYNNDQFMIGLLILGNFIKKDSRNVYKINL